MKRIIKLLNKKAGPQYISIISAFLIQSEITNKTDTINRLNTNIVIKFSNKD